MTSTTTVDHQRTDGSTLRLTFAEPDGALRGGLVVLHEGDGVTDGVLLRVKSLAGDGWLSAISSTPPTARSNGSPIAASRPTCAASSASISAARRHWSSPRTASSARR
jgi:hypothetical protein